MNRFRWQNFAWKPDGWKAKVENPNIPIPERFFPENIKVVEICDGDMLEDCNLSQIKPNTLIGGGLRGIRLVNCNLCNCIIPDDWPVPIGCLEIQQSFCSHENPKLIQFGLPMCYEMCEHVESYVPEIEVDGQIIKESVTVRKKASLKSAIRLSDRAKLEVDNDGVFIKPKAVSITSKEELS